MRGGVEAADAAVDRPDPEIPRRAFVERGDFVVGQTVARVEAAEAAVTKEGQPVAGCADPEVAGAVAEQLADRLVRQALRGRPPRELAVAKLRQLTAGAEPQIAGAILGDRVVLRPPLPGRPDGDLAVFESAQPAVGADPETSL